MDSPTVPILHPKLNKPSPGPRIEQLNVESIQTDPIYDIFSVGLRQTCETKQVSEVQELNSLPFSRGSHFLYYPLYDSMI